MAINCVSPLPCPTAPITVRDSPFERWMSKPISIKCATTASICSTVARSFITTIMSPARAFLWCDSRTADDFTSALPSLCVRRTRRRPLAALTQPPHERFHLASRRPARGVFIGDDLHDGAADDRRIHQGADLFHVLRPADPEAHRDRERCRCLHT